MNFLITNYNNPLLKNIHDTLKSNNESIKFISEHISHKSLKDFILKNEINIILHTDIIYDIDECQKLGSQAIKQNTNTINIISKICNELNIKLIYLSSHEVYGDYPILPLVENIISNPINTLGESQKGSEAILTNNTKNYFILRLSWVFGLENCYIKQIISNAKTPLIFCSEKIVNPTPINLIINIILTISKTTKFGTYNCATKNSCSKLDLTKFIFNFIDFPKEVSPFPDSILSKFTKTAYNSSLDCSLLEKTFDITIPSYKTEVTTYINSNFK